MSDSHERTKLLVTGAGGFLGRTICRMAGRKWKVHGTLLSHSPAMRGVHLLRLDLRNYADMKSVFQEIRPDAVIHTAALTDPNYCENNSGETEDINVVASINIARLCADLGVPCVFTSTDLVFDGLRPPYREEDPTCPVNVYGEQKARAEQGMMREYPLVTVCRLPLLFGDTGPARASFFMAMIESMGDGGRLCLFTDEYRTPLSGRSAAEGVLFALERVQGIIHLGGKQRISRFDFGKLLMRIVDAPQAAFTPCLLKDICMPAVRPPDVSLDSTKAYRLGFSPPPLEEDIRREVREMGHAP